MTVRPIGSGTGQMVQLTMLALAALAALLAVWKALSIGLTAGSVIGWMFVLVPLAIACASSRQLILETVEFDPRAHEVRVTRRSRWATVVERYGFREIKSYGFDTYLDGDDYQQRKLMLRLRDGRQIDIGMPPGAWLASRQLFREVPNIDGLTRRDQ